MPSRVPLVVAILALLLVPVLYVGSYFALLIPTHLIFSPSPGPARMLVTAHYRYGGQSTERLYWPLEQIDRRARPGMWSEDVLVHLE